LPQIDRAPVLAPVILVAGAFEVGLIRITIEVDVPIPAEGLVIASQPRAEPLAN
jgi:hypothetical protein